MKTMYPQNKIINDVLQIIEVFKTKKVNMDDGDALSRSVVRLSTLMVNLGQIVSEATFNANTKYSFRKFTYAKDYKTIRQDIDMKVKDAEIEAMIKSLDNQREEIEAQYQADLLKTLYDDCNRLVMAIQTRLRYIQNEKNGLSNN